MRKYLFLTFLGIFLLTGQPTQAVEAGERVNFFVNSVYDIKGRAELRATLLIKSQRAYFYVDDDHWNQLTSSNRDMLKNSLEGLADEFDLVIYPKERAVFGSEWNPGIDNDKRITILISPLVKDAGGYFNTNDEYPQSVFSNSNQREMIYLNSSYVSEALAKAFLAHEFQHLITFYQKTVLYNLEEDVWLNEARSEYASTLLGYDNIYRGSNLEKRVEAFLDAPSDSLTEWKNKISDYGAVSLFIQYLVDYYGKEILTSMVLNNQVGLASVNQALADLGRKERFSDVFVNWAITNYLNNCQLEAAVNYCYRNKNLTYERLHIDPTAAYSGFPNLIVRRSSMIKDWAPVWYRFRPSSMKQSEKDTLKIEFSGFFKDGDFRVPYLTLDKNGKVEINYISLTNQKGAAYVPNFISLEKSVILIPFNQYKKSGFTDNEPSASFSFTALSLVSTAPIISSVFPKSGSLNGGTEITVRGENFEPGTKVFLGGAAAADLKIIDKQTIVFTSPSHLAGPADLTVINPNQEQARLSQAFTYDGVNPFYPDGSLIRAKGDYKVYIVNGQYKRWIQSAKIFDFYGHLNWEAVIEVSPEQRDFYKDVWLIRAMNDFRVYEVDNSLTKHWLNMTAEEFTKSGRPWDMVYVVNDFERDFYKTGAAVMYKQN